MLRPDAEARLRADPLIDDAKIARILEDVAGLAPAHARTDARDRFKPSANGDHLLYLGKLPANRSQPQLTYQGERVQAIRYTYAVYAGRDPGRDATFRRRLECRVPECFSPEHWAVHTPVEPHDTRQRLGLGVLKDLYPLAFGTPPNPRPTSWTGGPWDALCPQGHPLRVYDLTTRHKGSYCATCYQHANAWHRSFKEWKATRALGMFSTSEDAILHLWRTETDPDHADLARVWYLLDQHYQANPHDPRTGLEVYAEISGAPTASPEPAHMTPEAALAAMTAAVDDLLAGLDAPA